MAKELAKLKIAMNRNKSELLAIKGGKPIYSKPLKPGSGPRKSEKTGERERKP